MTAFPSQYKPVYPAEKIVSPNVRNVSFQRGGVYGYEQRDAFGINSNRDTWNLTFVQKTAEGAEIYDFLLARKLDRKAFDWTAPDSLFSERWKCNEFSKEIFDYDSVRITATFVQCFEPPENTAWLPEGIAISEAIPVGTLTATSGSGGGGGTLWTPSQITTALWLDSSDASTVTTVGGYVSQLNDKSGNNRNASQGTTDKRPGYATASINGLNCMTSNGSQFVAIDTSLDVQSFVIVTQFNNPSAGNYQFIVGDSSDYDFHGTSSSATLLDSTYTSASVRYGSSWVNGVSIDPMSITKLSSVSLYIFNMTSNVKIKQFSDDRVYYGRGIIGNICEIIGLASNLNSTNRQFMEGYLAHKWGFAASLPSGHPYKSTAPTV